MADASPLLSPLVPPAPPSARALSLASALLSAAVLLPTSLAGGLALLVALAATTFSGLGPLAQCFYARRDAALLAALVAPAPGAPVRLVAGARGARLAVRWSPGGRRALPVAIPNGLGATLMSIGALHDRLVALGFSVLSYDRDGVGMSERAGAAPASAAETVADMHAVLEAAAPGARWLLVGPSMGSIVAQCYIAAHPGRVAGFLNMDGLPFPFAAKRQRFELAGRVYSLYAALVATGAVRLGLGLAGKALAPLATATFPLPAIVAQMNGRNFFASLAREMLTMLACADAARAAWGPAYDLAALTAAGGAGAACVAALASAEPAQCGDARGGAWLPLPRSRAELGADWAPRALVDAALEGMRAAHAAGGGAAAAPLPAAFAGGLAVRVMSARAYDFGAVGEAFYDKEMRAWAAAEHALHAGLAGARGQRVVYPERHHGQMFFSFEDQIAARVVELEEAAGDAGKGV